MNIAPPNVKPLVMPSIDASQHARGRREEGESFGEVLAAALRLPFGGQPAAGSDDTPVESGSPMAIDCHCALKAGTPVAIGEDAVRFDARPIVGPLFIPAVAIEEALSKPANPPQAPSSITETSSFEPALLRTFALAVSCVGAMVSRPVARGVTVPAPSRLGGRSPMGPTVRPLEPLASPRSNPWVAQAGLSVPAQAPETRKSEVRTDISLTLLADEVRVTVRGLDLTADEEEALANEARGLLASSDLGGRSLRVVTFRRA